MSRGQLRANAVVPHSLVSNLPDPESGHYVTSPFRLSTVARMHINYIGRSTLSQQRSIVAQIRSPGGALRRKKNTCHFLPPLLFVSCIFDLQSSGELRQLPQVKVKLTPMSLRRQLRILAYVPYFYSIARHNMEGERVCPPLLKASFLLSPCPVYSTDFRTHTGGPKIQSCSFASVESWLTRSLFLLFFASFLLYFLLLYYNLAIASVTYRRHTLDDKTFYTKAEGEEKMY